ncbi:MAG: GH92 family glycosyl hydrolase [Bacteroidales bacterium]|nr:GH92 family glycosyl hydrolase [Bacteroidales bacterium]
MKKYLPILLLLVACGPKWVDPIDAVDPLVATCGDADSDYFEPVENFVPHSAARCTPGVLAPLGMVNVGPVTRHIAGPPSGYSAHDTTITGFAFMRMSGSGWCAEFGNLLTQPTNGPLCTCYGMEDGSHPGYASPYRAESLAAEPGYYAVTLDRYRIRTECTATPHCGALRFTFPEDDNSRIQCDLAFRITGSSAWQEVNILNDSTFVGHMKYTPNEGGWGDGKAGIYYDLYFYAVLDKPVRNWGFWKAPVPDGLTRKDKFCNSEAYMQMLDAATVIREGTQCSGTCIGVFAEFPTAEGEQVQMKVGFSFVDAEGAHKNYEAEARCSDFDGMRARTLEQWRKELSKVHIAGGTPDQQTIFYTALYHTLVDPRIFTDCDGRFTAADGSIGQAEGYTRRTLFSGWDTFRSHTPLHTLVNPRLIDDLLSSQIALAEESGRGYYDRWEMLNSYTSCMLGNPTNSVLVDAYLKGIRGYDAEKALACAMKSSEKPLEGYSVYPDDMVIVSVQLENAYFDWCTARLAEALGHADIAAEFDRRGQAWRDAWYPEVGWFFPRHADGSWFDIVDDWQYRWFYGSCECNLFQQGLFVPHDLDGLCELCESPARTGVSVLVEKLDTMFENTPWTYGLNNYYLHGNEPVHWVPFLYNRIGQAWKTQKWVRTILERCYTNDIEGLVGNDDEGQMSAWYVLSAAGLHQICPGDQRVELCSPLFREVVFDLDPAYYPGKTFTVRTHGHGDYIQWAKLNGALLYRCWLHWDEIASGGKLEFWLGSEPNPRWGLQNH